MIYAIVIFAIGMFLIWKGTRPYRYREGNVPTIDSVVVDKKKKDVRKWDKEKKKHVVDTHYLIYVEHALGKSELDVTPDEYNAFEAGDSIMLDKFADKDYPFEISTDFEHENLIGKIQLVSGVLVCAFTPVVALAYSTFGEVAVEIGILLGVNILVPSIAVIVAGLFGSGVYRGETVATVIEVEKEKELRSRLTIRYEVNGNVYVLKTKQALGVYNKLGYGSQVPVRYKVDSPNEWVFVPKGLTLLRRCIAAFIMFAMLPALALFVACLAKVVG